MKILTAGQTREADSYTIEHEPVASIDLMERASGMLFSWFFKNISSDNKIAIFAGSGNNGGDAFALARMLFHEGYNNITIYAVKFNEFSCDCLINHDRAKEISAINIHYLEPDNTLPDLSAFSIIVDGIFGSGLNRPVTGYWGSLIEHINNSGKKIIAIDIPSGLFCQDNTDNSGSVIKATHTLSFQLPKLAFLFAENNKYVGNFHILDIKLHQEIINTLHTNYTFVEKCDIKPLIPARNTFDHKGTFGHAFLVAGGYQKTGAAILAAKACLRTGAGLLTVHVPQTAYTIMQTAVPEAMLCIDETEMEYCTPENLNNFSNAGIGPGIGTKKSVQNALLSLLTNSNKPMVLDADAINILSENKEWVSHIPEHSILTPHPGEFDRLTKKHNKGYDRLVTQIELSKKHNIFIVLKGAYTSTSTPDGKVYFNSTGNPGMATAGSGDVLTGIILSLLVQGYSPLHASLTGVFIHGMAGDFAKKEQGEESLIASDIINNIGKAYNYIKE